MKRGLWQFLTVPVAVVAFIFAAATVLYFRWQEVNRKLYSLALAKSATDAEWLA